MPTETPGFQATAIENKLSMRASLQTEIELNDVRLPADASCPAQRDCRLRSSA